jgi:hypothetical protein
MINFGFVLFAMSKKKAVRRPKKEVKRNSKWADEIYG